MKVLNSHNDCKLYLYVYPKTASFSPHSFLVKSTLNCDVKKRSASAQTEVLKDILFVGPPLPLKYSVLSVRMFTRPSVRVSILLSISLYGLYLRYPSTDSILLLHVEKPYIEAVQRGLLLFFFLKN